MSYNPQLVALHVAFHSFAALQNDPLACTKKQVEPLIEHVANTHGVPEPFYPIVNNFTTCLTGILLQSPVGAHDIFYDIVKPRYTSSTFEALDKCRIHYLNVCYDVLKAPNTIDALMFGNKLEQKIKLVENIWDMNARLTTKEYNDLTDLADHINQQKSGYVLPFRT